MDRSRDQQPPKRQPVAQDDPADVDRARERLSVAGTATIRADQQVLGLLAPGECVTTVRRGVAVERRSPGVGPGSGLRGDLYVTTRRLIHLGPVPFEYPLATITEAIVAGRLLLLRVDHGRGITIEVDDPVTLRLHIRATRVGVAPPPAAPRGLRKPGSDARPRPDS